MVCHSLPGRRFCKQNLPRGAKGAWIALNNSQIVPPAIDDLAGFAVRTVNDPRIIAHCLPLSDDDQPFGVDMQADPSFRKAGRHAVAIAFVGNQTRWRYAFGSCSIKPSNVGGRAISVGFSASHTSAMNPGKALWGIFDQREMQRSSSHGFSSPRSAKTRMTCHIRLRASCTFFPT